MAIANKGVLPGGNESKRNSAAKPLIILCYYVNCRAILINSLNKESMEKGLAHQRSERSVLSNPLLAIARSVNANAMRRQQTDDIIKFLKDNIEPLENNAYGPGYRASVYLTDGTFLPCVVFRNAKTVVNLAIRRFKEEQTGKGVFKRSSGLGYYDIVKTFVASGNCINDYDIDRVEKSKFAFPLTIQRQIKGETTMGWTGFAAKMKDGKHFGFGTTFHWEFFQMPDGYSIDDIDEIINHSYVLKTGELRSHRDGHLTRPDDYKDAIVYRERPFFECFIDNL